VRHFNLTAIEEHHCLSCKDFTKSKDWVKILAVVLKDVELLKNKGLILLDTIPLFSNMSNRKYNLVLFYVLSP
jgi:hypothetical protein